MAHLIMQITFLEPYCMFLKLQYFLIMCIGNLGYSIIQIIILTVVINYTLLKQYRATIFLN